MGFIRIMCAFVLVGLVASCDNFMVFKADSHTHPVAVTFKLASDVTVEDIAKAKSFYAITWANDDGRQVATVEYVYNTADPNAPPYLPLQDRTIVVQMNLRSDLVTTLGARLTTNPYVPGSGGPPGGEVIAQADGISILASAAYVTVDLHASGWTPCLQNMCGQLCIDLMTNPFHCGACGHMCQNPQGGFGDCVKGQCTIKCYGADRTVCGNACVTLQSDPLNCGACGTACAGMLVCSSGKCTDRCSSGTPCSGSCVDTSSDIGNCGACAVQCPVLPHSTPVCAMGVCGVGMCVASYGDCDGSVVNGCETNLGTNLEHCGACGHSCPSDPMGVRTCVGGICGVDCFPYRSCGGKCVDVIADRANCGACGNACPQGQVCAMGVCAPMCNQLQTNCSGVCVDTATDLKNCGACGMVCSGGANQNFICAASQCVVSCRAGFQDCDMQPGNGCESEIATDNKNCGACGKVCAQGSTCVAGMCTNAQCNDGKQDGDETDLDCGGSCKPCGLGKKCAADADCGKQDPKFLLGWKCLAKTCSEYIQVTAIGIDLMCSMDGKGCNPLSVDQLVPMGNSVVFAAPGPEWVPARNKNLGDAPPNMVLCASTRAEMPYAPKPNYMCISTTACGWGP